MFAISVISLVIAVRYHRLPSWACRVIERSPLGRTPDEL
jgi:hypothetical protein